jgi:DUF4097 and DUF4098 domain-containing protein YvlB
MDILGKIFNISGHGDNKSTVTINGKTYVGNNITISANGNVIIDGKETGQCDDRQISIEVVGDVGRIETASGDVKVSGNCGSVKTASGDVEVGNNVSGDISAVSGDIDVRGAVGGSCNTVSGDISHN